MLHLLINYYAVNNISCTYIAIPLRFRALCSELILFSDFIPIIRDVYDKMVLTIESFKEC